MEITWLGHCALRIQSAQAVVADPYDDGVGYELPDVSADIVTMSNDHPHHANAAGVEGNPRLLRTPGEYEIGGFYISGMGTPLTAPDAEQRRTNTVFTFRCEGVVVCHLGAITQTLTPRQLEDLNQTDVLVIPAGGGDTIPVGRAAQLINQISPRIVVPVRYRTPNLEVAASAQLEPLERLLGELGVAEAQPQPRLNVTSTNLPRDTTVAALRPVR